MVTKLCINALQISNKIFSYSKQSINKRCINIDKIINNNCQPLSDYVLLYVVCKGYAS